MDTWERSEVCRHVFDTIFEHHPEGPWPENINLALPNRMERQLDYTSAALDDIKGAISWRKTLSIDCEAGDEECCKDVQAE